jgi:hypothetical protein
VSAFFLAVTEKAAAKPWCDLRLQNDNKIFLLGQENRSSYPDDNIYLNKLISVYGPKWPKSVMYLGKAKKIMCQGCAMISGRHMFMGRETKTGMLFAVVLALVSCSDGKDGSDYSDKLKKQLDSADRTSLSGGSADGDAATPIVVDGMFLSCDIKLESKPLVTSDKKLVRVPVYCVLKDAKTKKKLNESDVSSFKLYVKVGDEKSELAQKVLPKEEEYHWIGAPDLMDLAQKPFIVAEKEADQSAAGAGTVEYPAQVAGFLAWWRKNGKSVSGLIEGGADLAKSVNDLIKQAASSPGKPTDAGKDKATGTADTSTPASNPGSQPVDNSSNPPLQNSGSSPLAPTVPPPADPVQPPPVDNNDPGVTVGGGGHNPAPSQPEPYYPPQQPSSLVDRIRDRIIGGILGSIF